MGKIGSIEEVTLSDKIKILAKCFLGNVSSYDNNENPIFIFSTRRSGSTLLMRMIYSQKKVDYIDQPLDLWKPHLHFDMLPHPYKSQYISLQRHDEELLHKFFRDLINGNLRLRNQWDVTDSDFSYRANRLVVKTLNSLALIDWFDEKFNLEIVYHLRHPIPVSLSVMKRGWGNVASAYLENEQFCKRHLESEEIDFGWRVLREGSRLQKFVLEWCLRNYLPLSCHNQKSWLTLTYEELVSQPKEASELICHKLNLPNPSRMSKVVDVPTATTRRSSQKTIDESGTASLVDKWVRQVSPDERSEVAKVLEIYGVKVYNAHKARPQKMF
ncbi:sulfotransferase [Salinibacter ruber]|uniref:sulfotransferase n=1 Tax=Salinibacter ruber TaxID=146919 RepID=UPI002169A4AD|nr:sulfotransferase [Salinibacter ruber]MCS4055903.1 hypothetical protein [Salinibacter ruber]